MLESASALVWDPALGSQWALASGSACVSVSRFELASGSACAWVSVSVWPSGSVFVLASGLELVSGFEWNPVSASGSQWALGASGSA